MLERTRRLWTKQDQPVGDRHRVFAAVADAVPATAVLYPGSYVDLAPSFIWPAVTYVDVDERAKRFFADQEGIDELLAEHGADPAHHVVRFIHADYADDLDLPPSSVDLLVSLYGGFVSEHCTHHLSVGGHLLVNLSHGDAAMASIDPRYRLHGVVDVEGDRPSVRTNDLETYLVPKRGPGPTVEQLRHTGRGIAYTRSPFAYLFERIG